MKMRVMAVTHNSTRLERIAAQDRGLDAYQQFMVERGKILHLECGHEFRIAYGDPSPSHFDCRYCSHVSTIEEQRVPCECVKCCDGEHAGNCKECAGWGDRIAGEGAISECDYCLGTGACPKCCEKRIAHQVEAERRLR